MASLEYIHYTPHRSEISGKSVKKVPYTAVRDVDRLPQIVWTDGKPWREVNVWSLEMGRNRGIKIKTVHSLMEHLHKYANWLEQEHIDWRHFPQTRSERVLVRYRGALVDTRDSGALSPSTTSARMNAVIRFYRYASNKNFISHDAPKWKDKPVVLHYFDTIGFQRTLNRITTDISIPNRARPGIRLEGGLLPLSVEHMTELLKFTKPKAPDAPKVSKELHLMLLTGFYTGARLGTITTLRVPALNNALRDPMVPGMWVVPVGPGTGIATKFDVSGDLLVPDPIMKELKDYAISLRHLNRAIKATEANRSYLFLSRYGNPYQNVTVNRGMVDLRRARQAANLKFLQNFKFHQTRATFGTWLMSICLKVTSVKAAIEFVRRAMHHKHEATTFGYIRFIEHTKAKIEVANAFTEAFLGIKTRLREATNA